MTNDLRDLYQEVILDHSKRPRNFHTMPQADRKAEGYNPLCGDEVELRLNIEGDVISGVSFTGRGCSISQASGSMLTEAIKGKTVAQARALAALFTRMMTDPEFVPEEDVGDLEALQGVAKYPVRVKCATLAWHALQDGLDRHCGAA